MRRVSQNKWETCVLCMNSLWGNVCNVWICLWHMMCEYDLCCLDWENKSLCPCDFVVWFCFEDAQLGIYDFCLGMKAIWMIDLDVPWPGIRAMNILVWRRERCRGTGGVEFINSVGELRLCWDENVWRYLLNDYSVGIWSCEARVVGKHGCLEHCPR